MTTAYNQLEQLFGKRLVGWKAIADFLEIDVRTAQRRAASTVHPLPVRHDAAGAYCYQQWAVIWLHQTDMAFKAWRQLNKGRLDGDADSAPQPAVKCREEPEVLVKRSAKNMGSAASRR